MSKKSNKKIAPIIISVAVIIFSLCYASVFIAMAFSGIIAAIVAVIGISAELAVCIGIVLSLRERIKEINGGEEDEALKY